MRLARAAGATTDYVLGFAPCREPVAREHAEEWNRPFDSRCKQALYEVIEFLSSADEDSVEEVVRQIRLLKRRRGKPKTTADPASADHPGVFEMTSNQQ